MENIKFYEGVYRTQNGRINVEVFPEGNKGTFMINLSEDRCKPISITELSNDDIRVQNAMIELGLVE